MAKEVEIGEFQDLISKSERNKNFIIFELKKFNK